MTENGIPANFQSIFEVIDYIEQNPKNTKEILDLVVPRIFTDGYTLCQPIARAAERNPEITEEYIRLCFSDSDFRSKFLIQDCTPPLFHCFLSNNFMIALNFLQKYSSNSPEQIHIKLHFYRFILQKCENEGINEDAIIRKIAQLLDNEIQSLPFAPRLIYNIEKGSVSELRDKSLELIEVVTIRQIFADLCYESMLSGLCWYDFLKKYGDKIVKECRDKKQYSPLLFLLDFSILKKNVYGREVIENPINIINNIIRLSVLNTGIKFYETLPNELRITKKDIENDIYSILSDETRFWDFLSELIVLNRLSTVFDKDRVIIKDKQFGKKKNDANFIDFEIQMKMRNILLEVTSPKMQKSVLFHDVGFLNNHYASRLSKKRDQLKKGLKKADIPAEDFFEPYFVIIDTTNTSLGYSYQDFFERSVNGLDIISGIILLAWTPIFKNNRPQIAISGTIYSNPRGKNLLSENETTELNQIFNGEFEV